MNQIFNSPTLLSIFVAHGFFDVVSVADALVYACVVGLCYVCVSELTDLSMILFICMSMYHFGQDIGDVWSGAILFGVSTVHVNIWKRSLIWLGVQHAERIIYLSRFLCVAGMLCADTVPLVVSFCVGLAGPLAIFYWACCVHAPLSLWNISLDTYSIVFFVVIVVVMVTALKTTKISLYMESRRHMGHVGIAIAFTHMVWMLKQN